MLHTLDAIALASKPKAQRDMKLAGNFRKSSKANLGAVQAREES
jgi:hypothetical protein